MQLLQELPHGPYQRKRVLNMHSVAAFRDNDHVTELISITKTGPTLSVLCYLAAYSL